MRTEPQFQLPEWLREQFPNRFFKQSNLHKPEEGIIGDCYRTCLEILLNVPKDTLPIPPVEIFSDVIAFNNLYEEILNEEFNLTQVDVYYLGHSLTDVLTHVGNSPSLGMNKLYMLSGMSAGGTDHATIAYEDKLVWDPSLEDNGIIGPGSHEFYTITFLADVRHKIMNPERS